MIYILVKERLHRHRARGAGTSRTKIKRATEEEGGGGKRQKKKKKAGTARNFSSLVRGCGSCTRAEVETERRRKHLICPAHKYEQRCRCKVDTEHTCYVPGPVGATGSQPLRSGAK